jgi:phosphate:Na+ symporter
MITTLFGGLGLFLLGMVLLTDGLKAAAGEALRDVLARFTGGPYSAFLSGAALTALVQSSSATIVATIGFVSAGLLTFTQSVGVILGAAVGTTSTGWLVAFLGLRFSVSALAFPLVGIGALARLFARGRWAHLGLAVAGFGLIFVGIASLQAGMAQLSERIDLAGLGAETLGGRLVLVLMGTVMTVVMQSSSAAVATTLAAVQTGTISLTQAALLVIGQNVGTTVTAALATIGASVPARRTAVAQMLFNAFAGMLAFLTLPLVLPGLASLAAMPSFGRPGSVAAFHTGFNLVGVGLLLPITARYAALVTRLVPDRSPVLTRNLDPSVRSIPPVAIEAARRAVLDIAVVLFGLARSRLTTGAERVPGAGELERARRALGRASLFLAGVRSAPDAGPVFRQHLSLLHAVDHLERLADALADPPAGDALHEAAVEQVVRELARPLSGSLRWLEGRTPAPPAAELEAVSRQIAEERRQHRPRLMERTASGALDPTLALRQLDAMRWVDRIGYHGWRALHHLTHEDPSPGPVTASFDPADHVPAAAPAPPAPGPG